MPVDNHLRQAICKGENFEKTLLAVLLLVGSLSVAQAQKVTGAGATFPGPIYSKWFTQYSAAHPGVEINYQQIGSGGGIQQVTSGIVDFGASDMPMTDQALAASKVKLIHIPTVLGAVVPIFNVPGVNDLRFSPDVLADIYLAKITTWNDPRIAKDNPGVKLPGDKIIIVHRSDGSGTTFIWTDYLSKVSNDWKNGPGSVPRSTGPPASAAATMRAWPHRFASSRAPSATSNSSTPFRITSITEPFATRPETGSRVRSKASQMPQPRRICLLTIASPSPTLLARTLIPSPASLIC